MGRIPQVAKAVQPLLTTVADAAAAESGFVRRVRKVTGATCVQALAFGWLGHPAASLGPLTQAGARCGLAIGPQGPAQRFTERAADCLRRVLEAALGVLVAAEVAAPAAALRRFNGVYVSDSTTIMPPACLAAVWAGCGGRVAANTRAGLEVQARWEPTTGRLELLPLTAARTSDQAADRAAPPLPAGALRLVDLGDIALHYLGDCLAQGAAVLCRLPARPTLPDAEGGRGEVGALLAAQRPDTLDLPIRPGQRERVPLRPLARRLAPAAAEQRRRRLRDDARRGGHTPSRARLALADWAASITTLGPGQLSAEEGLALARARWQIELLFKLWKQHGQVDAWRSAQPWRIRREVYATRVALLIRHCCLLLVCRADPRRSLVKAAQVVRDRAPLRALACGRAAARAAALAALAAGLAHAGRVTKRRQAPATADRLLAFPEALMA